MVTRVIVGVVSRRREQANGDYTPFNAYARKCLGSGLALLEMGTILFELARRVKWTVDKNFRLKLAPVGYHFVVLLFFQIRGFCARKRCSGY